MNNVKSNVVEIDGALFKTLLESAAGKSLKEISLENGFSDSFLRMVVKTGKASPSAQTVARIYGIEPDAYTIKAKTPETDEASSKQLSIDDIITEDARDVLKAVVKEAIAEAFTSLTCKTLNVQYDERGRRYIATLFINKEDIEEG